MAEQKEIRSNWLGHLTGTLAWFILIGGILYSLFELVFVGFWSGLLLAVGVIVACLFLSIGLMVLSQILLRLESIEAFLERTNK